MHFRTKHWIDAGKLCKREYGWFDEETIDGEIVRQIKIFERAPGHHQRRNAGDRNARCFWDKRHRARRTWVHFEHINAMVLDCKLHVHQTAYWKRAREFAGVVPHRLNVFFVDLHRRQHAWRIAGMNAGLFDVLLNGSNHACRIIGQCIDIELCRLLQKFINQHRAIRRESDCVAHIAI